MPADGEVSSRLVPKPTWRRPMRGRKNEDGSWRSYVASWSKDVLILIYKEDGGKFGLRP